MSRPLQLILLAAVAFVTIIVLRLPASWLQSRLPKAVHCQSLEGSVWAGRCQQLLWDDSHGTALQLDSVGWTVRPLKLLSGRLGVALRLARGADQITADVVANRTEVSIENLAGNAKLNHALVRALPEGWQGELRAQNIAATLVNGRLRSLGGIARVDALTDASGATLGSYELQMDAVVTPPFTGKLQDKGGALALEASVTIAEDFSWQIDGSIAARAGAQQWADKLQALGAADAAGRRPFSVAGTF
jgi:Type II secretion system (T2SS), protein N